MFAWSPDRPLSSCTLAREAPNSTATLAAEYHLTLSVTATPSAVKRTALEVTANDHAVGWSCDTEAPQPLLTKSPTLNQLKP